MRDILALAPGIRQGLRSALGQVLFSVKETLWSGSKTFFCLTSGVISVLIGAKSLLIKLCSCQYAFSGIYLVVQHFLRATDCCAIFANAQLACITIFLIVSSGVVFSRRLT